jgi:uncharacterized protein (TIGR03437 family)
VAPGRIAAAFGNFLLNPPVVDAVLPLSMILAGFSLPWVTTCAPPSSSAIVCPAIVVGGDAPLYYVSAAQVNLQVPWEMLPDIAGQLNWSYTISAMLNGEISPAQTITVAQFAPMVFTMNSRGTGPGAILDSNYQLVDPSNPATADSFILIYCTGLGPVTDQPPTGQPALATPLSWTTTTPLVSIGGVAAAVSFSGLAPGFVGLYQINAEVPAGLPANSATPVVISMGGAISNTVTTAVQ